MASTVTGSKPRTTITGQGTLDSIFSVTTQTSGLSGLGAWQR